jgi:hypothetical protein
MRGPAWTAEEVALLRKHYSSVGGVGMVRLVNRTVRACYDKAAELGLHTPMARPRWIAGDTVGPWTIVRRLRASDCVMRCPCGVTRVMTPSRAKRRPCCSECAKAYRAHMRETPIRERVREFRPSPVKLRAVMKAVCEQCRLSERALTCKRRARRVAHPRQLAMALCRELTTYSLPRIGRAFNRDHATVIHAVAAVQRRVIESPKWANHYSTLKALLTPHQEAAE